MNENVRRLLDHAADRLTRANEIDQPADRAFVEALGLTPFDIEQLEQGRVTGPIAAIHNALAELRTVAGVTEEPSGIPWLDQAKADADLSRTAKKVAGWLDQNGDGEIALQSIGSELRCSVRSVRAALDELLSWGYVDLRPSIRSGAIRVKMLR